MNLDYLARAWTTLRAVVADPGSNLTASVLILSVASIIALILIIGIALVAYFIPMARLAAEAAEEAERVREERDEDDVPDIDEGSERPAHRPAAVRAYTIAVWLLLVGSVLSLYVGTGTTTYCVGACHKGTEATEAWSEDPHSSVRCASCHEGSVSGALVNLASRVECGISYFSDEESGRRPVEDSRCLACHEDALDRTITYSSRGLRVDHRAPLQEGVPCSQCHGRTGHGTRVRIGMSSCIRCHDGAKASGACVTCHLGDPSQAGRQERQYPRTIAANRDCGGCHRQERCDACHGTRMPHSEVFKAYMHARDAAFEKKTACWKCHTDVDCGKCHGRFETGHALSTAGNRRDHVTMLPRWLRQQPVVGCGCHTKAKVDNMCALCHDDAAPLFRAKEIPSSD